MNILSIAHLLYTLLNIINFIKKFIIVSFLLYNDLNFVTELMAGLSIKELVSHR